MFVNFWARKFGSRSRLFIYLKFRAGTQTWRALKKHTETLLIPQDFNEAKELITKLSIEDLKTFCFTLGLPQNGTKANLKERLLKYYKGKFSVTNGAPVPTPRKKSAVKSPQSKEKEMSLSETIDLMHDGVTRPKGNMVVVVMLKSKMAAISARSGENS